MPAPLRRLRERWDLPVDPRPLAVARIGVGIAALLTFTEHYFRLSTIADGDLAMPGVDGLPAVRAITVTVYSLVTLFASVALILGAGARYAAGTVTACAWFGFLWEQQTYSNHMMFIAWLALWLAVVPSDAAWSLPSRTDGRGTVCWGDQLLVMSQLSVCYLFAGLAKLNPGFLSGDALQGFVSIDIHLPGPVWTALAVSAVATEIGVSVALWLPRTRWLAGLAGLLLHLSIMIAMWSDAWALAAFGLACLSQYPMFLSPRPPLRADVSLPVRALRGLVPAPGRDLG